MSYGGKSTWAFRSRFRRHAFGWRSQPAILRIYGKRWDIEVFFKMVKQHLKLAKEIQCRDFDALIAHTTIVFMRYMFLAYRCRMKTDHRTFWDLFYACSRMLTK